MPRCADGYMGQRCEFKDLDGSYLRKLFCKNQFFFLFIVYSVCECVPGQSTSALTITVHCVRDGVAFVRSLPNLSCLTSF